MPYGPKPRSPAERLWTKVKRGAAGECWEWQGATDRFGYGFLSGGPLYDNMRWVKAHRIAWESHHDQRVPDGLYVLHHCDNPPCCNPGHLYVGTKLDNARDREARKRSADHQGEHNGNAKLTEDDVRAIIAELQRLPRRSQVSIAAQFGIKQPQISRIMRRENWAYLWDE